MPREPISPTNWRMRLEGFRSCLSVLVIMMLPAVVAVVLSVAIQIFYFFYNLEETVTNHLFQ